ncbi:MAG: hypothetical protein IRZ08_04185 [Frankia sp.]|nr:hypothetical protein [Frankia sp.]
MNDVLAGQVLAAEVSAGVSGLVAFLLLALASAAVFYFLAGSLRRLRGNVARGEFAANASRPRTRRDGHAPDAAGEPGGQVPAIPRQPTDTTADPDPNA